MKNIFIALIILIASGCNYLDDYSQDLVVAKSVSDLDEVLLGSVYLQSKSSVKDLAYGDAGWWLHIMDDDLNGVIAPKAPNRTHNQAMRVNYFGYTCWQWEVGRNYAGNNIAGDNALWDDLYRRINVCNIILEEMKEMSIPEEDQKDAFRVQGEAHFVRAQFYFMLVNIYANAYEPDKAATTLGVPLKLTDYVEHDKDKTTQFERASVEQVYRQIVTDLKAAVDCFTQSPQTHSFYRASKEASLLLLSRVYLFMQDWTNARTTAAELLELKSALKNYTIADEEEEIISRTNPEILFSQGSLNLQEAIKGNGGDFCISADLYRLYSDEDCRKTLFFSEASDSDSISLGMKYRHGEHQSYVSDLYLLRTSEAWLNMMEACAMLDKTDEASKWLNDFRAFRIAGWQPVNYDLPTVIQEIRDERRKELCLEGHRWFDLRRYAVCRKAPWQKEIERVFALYNWNSDFSFDHAEVYRLEKNDPAYTLAIPKSVLEFDKGMPDNERIARPLMKTILYNWTTNGEE